MNTKKTAFGIAGAAAASLLTLGLAAPAMASTPDSNSTTSSRTSSSSTNTQLSKNYEQMIERVTQILNGNTVTSPVVISPSVGIGDVASGNAIGSGNTTSIPVLSGNDAALASGNTTNTGNGTSALNGSGNGNSASNSQGNGNSSTVSTTTGQIGSNVNQTVNDILGNLGLSSSSDGGSW